MARTLFCYLLLTFTSLSLTFGADTSKGDTTLSGSHDQPLVDFINVEIGSFFAGSEHQGGWGTPLDFHISYGTHIFNEVSLLGNVDYYQYRLARGGDMSGLWSPGSGKRQDVALYASISFSQIFVAGLGAYYTKSDSVYLVDPIGSVQMTSSIGGLSEVRFFYIFGVKYDIHIFEGIYLPIGLFVRQSYGDRIAPIFFRTGLEIRL